VRGSASGSMPRCTPTDHDVTRRRPPRRTRAARAARTTFTLVAVGALLAAAGIGILRTLDRSTSSAPPNPECSATLDGTRWLLTPAQADNAALVAAVAVRQALPARAVTIALATAMQESKLMNIDHGDRDSVGLFQQRTSQGWGTVEQIMDPVYATGKFYDALVKVPGYQDLPITEAAQAVQRSGYPEAYAEHETQARAWASALTGWSPGTLTCVLPAPSGSGSTDAFGVRMSRDLGALAVSVEARGAQSPAPVSFVVDARPLDAGSGDPAVDARSAWALAQWTVAVALDQQVTAVTVADQEWTRDSHAWSASATAVPAGQVRITLAG